MDEPGAAYESEKYSYVIGLGREPEIFVVAAKGPYNSMADLKAGKKLRLGSGQPADNIALATMTVIHCLDLDAKLIAGSKGMAPLIMSIMQGEVIGAAIPLAPTLRYIEQGQVKPLFAVSGKRVSALPNVPALTELVPLKGEKIELIKMWDDTFFQSWLVFAAPEIPKDRLNFLQQTFGRMVKDPETNKQLNNVWGYKNEIILSGDELVEITKSMAKDKVKIKRLFEKLIDQYRS
jgi:tripartite-type tricarboxylate transporter receptor subunit TctC